MSSNYALEMAIKEWRESSAEDRQQVTQMLAAECSKLSQTETDAGQEPSALYGAFSSARRILWRLLDEQDGRVLDNKEQSNEL